MNRPVLYQFVCSRAGYDCSGGAEPRVDPETGENLGVLCQAHYGERLQAKRTRPVGGSFNGGRA